jgi:hypothetical protein
MQLRIDGRMNKILTSFIIGSPSLEQPLGIDSPLTPLTNSAFMEVLVVLD